MSELTPAQKEAYARAKTSVNDLFSLELRHPSFPEPIRLISYDRDVVVELEDTAPANPGEEVTFTGVAFKSPEEKINDEPANGFSFMIGGISSQALPYLEVATESTEPIAVTIRYVSLDVRGDNVIGVSRPSEMQVRKIVVSILAIQVTLGYTNTNSRNLDV